MNLVLMSEHLKDIIFITETDNNDNKIRINDVKNDKKVIQEPF